MVFYGSIIFTVPDTFCSPYERYDCLNTDTDPLLQHADGQCGSWARFMNDVNKAQGIDRMSEWVTMGANHDDGFIVKNWGFVGPGQAAAAIQGNVGPYTHMNIIHANGDIIAPNRKGYHWDWFEVNDQAGAPGQSNSNPASLFNRHFFLRYNIAGQDRWFDPSYGVEYVGLTEFQRLQNFEDVAIEEYFSGFNATVDGSVIGYDLNRDGVVDGNDVGPTGAYLFRKNIAGNLEVGLAYRDI